MDTHRSIPRQVVTSAYALVDKMPPLKKIKNPKVAAVAGFALGGIGLALYFGTIIDFLVPVFIWIVMMVVALPTGETLIVAAPVFCAIFGYRRAMSSNAKLERGSQMIVEAEVISEHPKKRAQILQQH